MTPHTTGPHLEDRFKLLNDEPYCDSRDPLGFAELAEPIATLIKRSGGSTPLVLGIKSGWGRGKSSMMHQLQKALKEPNTETVWFNAWTADEGEALEALVRSVLAQLGPGTVRRAARKKLVFSWVRLVLALILGWFKMGSVVDAVWREVAGDPKVRNELGDLIRHAVDEWTKTPKKPKKPKKDLLVVFIDDLDRCDPVNVMQVLGAIKLYMAARGLVFIVGYDQAIITDAVLKNKKYDIEQYDKSEMTKHFLEKIVQLEYRLPDIGDEQARKLLDHYLKESGINERPAKEWEAAPVGMFDESMKSLTIKLNDINPRRTKRFLNTFIISYRSDAEWAYYGAGILARVLIIDENFPEFAEWLRWPPFGDPVQLFLDYVEVRAILRSHQKKLEDNEEISKVTRLSKTLGLGIDLAEEAPKDALLQIESVLPLRFPRLADNEDFNGLLAGLLKELREHGKSLDQLCEKMRSYLAKPRQEAGSVLVVYEPESQAVAERIRRKTIDKHGNDSMLEELGEPVSATEGSTMSDTNLVKNWMKHTDVLVVLIGPATSEKLAAGSDFLLRRSLAAAMEVPRIRILSVLHDGAEMPSTLPDGISERISSTFPLSSRAWEYDIDALMDLIDYWRIRSFPDRQKEIMDLIRQV